ncbi:MAG: YbjN domain-containing protein [Bifidobacteriaceae bacterium]|jgi:hypothetical protein|nr:YbjN domain-containing protein [Bifidobacteriaceae bacterium]
MSLFSKPEPAPRPVTGAAPLGRDRIVRVMDQHGWVYDIDSDGDIGGFWGPDRFFFFVSGPDNCVLQVRSRWHQNLPIELRSAVREVLDEWHRQTNWPKGYTRVDDRGRLWIEAEHTVDFGAGVTDAQLDDTVVMSIRTELQLFDFLAGRFPVTVSRKAGD